jgi:methionine biosynthesis protein MetW
MKNTRKAETAARGSLRPDLLTLASMIEPGEMVLDLGCGGGELLRHLIDTRQVVARGIELTEAGVLACVRRGVSVRQGNLNEGLEDYPDGSVDTVVLSYTIPYLNQPEFIIKEMLRVGKRAILSFPNWGHWRCRLGLLFKGRFPTVPGFPQAWDESPRARPLTVRDFDEFCARHEIRTVRKICLSGGRILPSWASGNLMTTMAIYELKRQKYP